MAVNLNYYVNEHAVVDENVEIGLPGENGEPFDHRAGDEVGDAGLSDGIAGAHWSRGD